MRVFEVGTGIAILIFILGLIIGGGSGGNDYNHGADRPLGAEQ